MVGENTVTKELQDMVPEDSVLQVGMPVRHETGHMYMEVVRPGYSVYGVPGALGLCSLSSSHLTNDWCPSSYSAGNRCSQGLRQRGLELCRPVWWENLRLPPHSPSGSSQIPMPLSVPKKPFLSSSKTFFPFHFLAIVITSEMASFTSCQPPHEALALLCPETPPHTPITAICVSLREAAPASRIIQGY